MTKILAIDPSSREFGYAVLVDDRLTVYGIKSLRRPGRARLDVLATQCTSLLDAEKPDRIIVVSYDHAQEMQQEWHSRVAGQMATIARQRGVPSYRLDIEIIKQTIAGHSGVCKWELADAVCTNLPHLRARLWKKRTPQQRYMSHLFVAVACGLTAYRLDQQGQPETYAANNH